VPHPIAAGNRLEGRDCQGWRLRHRLGDATGGSALDRPVLEGCTIGSDEAPMEEMTCQGWPGSCMCRMAAGGP
jgi:hypothetical protein